MVRLGYQIMFICGQTKTQSFDAQCLSRYGKVES